MADGTTKGDIVGYYSRLPQRFSRMSRTGR